MNSPHVSAHPALQEQADLAFSYFCEHKVVAFTGQSGTGKSHFAQAFHYACWGSGAPFVSQHAAGLEAARFESQLFGHVKGAFTGAVQAFPGLAGMAQSGTLCIEEIEALGLDQQARLLRFIQERTFRRVGDVHELAFDGALAITSRAPLQQLLAENRIREDLFYRISGNELQLWPFVQRPSDHQQLFDRMVQTLMAELGSDVRRPNDADFRALFERPLPGNGHTMRNLLLQSMIRQCPVAHIKDPMKAAFDDVSLPNEGSLKSDLARCEKQLLMRALRQIPESRDELARYLGISRRALMYKLKLHGLSQRAQYDGGD